MALGLKARPSGCRAALGVRVAGVGEGEPCRGRLVALPPEPGQAGKTVGVGEFVVIQHQCLQCWEPHDVPLACQRCDRSFPVSAKILGTEQRQGTSSTSPGRISLVHTEVPEDACKV